MALLTSNGSGLGNDGKGPSNVEILLSGLLGLLKSQDTFQLKDCDGVDIGPEQTVLKTVNLNKQVAKICNVEELATAIATAIGNLQSTGSATLYNTPDCIVLNGGGASYTVNANTVHSLSYKCMRESGKIKIGSGAAITLLPGEADGWEASTTLSQAFTFTAPNDCIIKIILTKA